MATNGWITFNASAFTATTTYLGLPGNLVMVPTPPEYNTLMEFMLVAKTCKWIEKLINQRDVDAYQIFDQNAFALPGISMLR